MSNPIGTDTHHENNISHPYERLTPDCILDALEDVGFEPTGSLLALNSYENRVYQVSLEDDTFVIAKFYRPNRWSDAAILEEHDFSYELKQHEIPIVVPIMINTQSLFKFNGFRFAVFPRQGGRTPELEQAETLKQLGRFLGRMHAVGATKPFTDRPKITVQNFGFDSLTFLLDNDFISPEVRTNYQYAAEEALQLVEQRYDAILPRNIRLHGDCHPGNLLWRDDAPHFVDLDDCRMGPAVQDLWMLLSGTNDEMSIQFRHLLEGYETFFEFDPAELSLIEALRTLRLLHYSAWLARRWDDPAFPQHFPWFDSPRYWEEQMITLREQIERLQQPSIQL
ncbi:MAG: serine/threonine protein kinase [Gammaproteobacteria bacterium]|nr:MAG: serine/threonine protein kinase [Gammaproteobacteria bacterium]